MSAAISSAQTFTAGRDGVLAGVSIDTYDANEEPPTPSAPLRVSIRNTENGLPGQTVLATTVLDSQVVPISQLITFPQHPQIHSGVQYAIVLNLENPQPSDRAGWIGSVGNAYPRGDECASFNAGVDWFCYSDPAQQQFDNHFEHVRESHPHDPHVKEPVQERRLAQQPGVQEPGQCIAFVNHGP